MTEAYKAQFKAQTLAQENAKPPTRTAVPPAGVRAVAGLNASKEQPGPKADTPVRWQVAGPLHAEQFPGEFRLAITGPLPMLPALVKALEELARAAIIKHIS